jgi:general stress protein 26
MVDDKAEMGKGCPRVGTQQAASLPVGLVQNLLGLVIRTISNTKEYQIMAHHTATEHSEAYAKVNDLIKGIRLAMLTTVGPDGHLRSRPMDTQQMEFDGDLWFMTEADAPKVADIAGTNKVNVSYANPEKQRYVSVQGHATLVRDRAKIKELWSPEHKIWFPNGPDDPNLALIKVKAEEIEYWDSSSNPVGQVIGFVKALVTGKEQETSDNEKIKL